MSGIRDAIRIVPDYPKPGIDFFDITTLLKSPEHLRTVLDGLVDLFEDLAVDKVVGIEARGFFFAPTVAYRLGAGFVPVRKVGKLPARTSRESYELEYGMAEMEMHRDAVNVEGERFLVVDDVLATGGTASAAGRLVGALGGEVVAYGFLLEIEALEGRKRLVASGSGEDGPREARTTDVRSLLKV
jgi:adenine phosphoribosyltransferase